LSPAGRGNFEIGNSKDIFDAHTTPLFNPIPDRSNSPSEIGIKEEDDKSHLDCRPPDIFLHARIIPLVASIGERREALLGCVLNSLHRCPFQL